MFGAWLALRVTFPKRYNASDIGPVPDALALFFKPKFYTFGPCSEPSNAASNNNRSSSRRLRACVRSDSGPKARLPTLLTRNPASRRGLNISASFAGRHFT
jgi:hypothetical protein